MTKKTPHIHGTAVPTAEFQKLIGAYLDRVVSGEVLTLTRWRRPAAVVVPTNQYEALLQDHLELEAIRARRRRNG
ncbi:type II toxin-antitoxin system Phd/YefM family antitoxin [Kitasatospora sp. NPDC048343]|uniref:type II toxin-antitoxin system Phd/YefM family antitoxin n=1 Tax=Kitasatospora sp. NPDC048343 TaxID=3154717 RepID=UPI0033E4FD8C